MKILVAITGASGFPLAVRLLEELRKKGIERHLILTKNAQLVREYETEYTEKDLVELCEHSYKPGDLQEKICSGSFPLDAIVVIPCSMNTLAKIANGIEDNTVTRAAGVHLKQERQVILVPRETPLSLAHLRNMTRAKEIGCSIVPPILAHYTKPKTVEDLDNYVVGKVLELLKIEHTLYEKWSGKK